MQRAGFELGSTNSPGANFERPQAGPKGGGQDARSNLAGRAINRKATFLGGFFINNLLRGARFELGSTNSPACTFPVHPDRARTRRGPWLLQLPPQKRLKNM
jgi:hypothetical protein